MARKNGSGVSPGSMGWLGSAVGGIFSQGCMLTVRKWLALESSEMAHSHSWCLIWTFVRVPQGLPSPTPSEDPWHVTRASYNMMPGFPQEVFRQWMFQETQAEATRLFGTSLQKSQNAVCSILLVRVVRRLAQIQGEELRFHFLVWGATCPYSTRTSRGWPSLEATYNTGHHHILILTPLPRPSICPPQRLWKCLCPHVTTLCKASGGLPFPTEEGQLFTLPCLQNFSCYNSAVFPT